jgi:hypothetical protein
VVSFLGLFHQNLTHLPVLSSGCYIPRPPHAAWLHLPNDIWGWVQITKLTELLYNFVFEVPGVSKNFPDCILYGSTSSAICRTTSEVVSGTHHESHD